MGLFVRLHLLFLPRTCSQFSALLRILTSHPPTLEWRGGTASAGRIDTRPRLERAGRTCGRWLCEASSRRTARVKSASNPLRQKAFLLRGPACSRTCQAPFSSGTNNKTTRIIRVACGVEPFSVPNCGGCSALLGTAQDELTRTRYVGETVLGVSKPGRLYKRASSRSLRFGVYAVQRATYPWLASLAWPRPIQMPLPSGDGRGAEVKVHNAEYASSFALLSRRGHRTPFV